MFCFFFLRLSLKNVHSTASLQTRRLKALRLKEVHSLSRVQTRRLKTLRLKVHSRAQTRRLSLKVVHSRGLPRRTKEVHSRENKEAKREAPLRQSSSRGSVPGQVRWDQVSCLGIYS